MLVALLNQKRIVAAAALKGHAYFCPACCAPVILRKGNRTVHHFAHKPQAKCAGVAGETLAHLKAKALFYDYFQAQGRIVEAEYPMQASRADICVQGIKGMPIVFEMQQAPITPEDIAARTQAYFLLGAAVTWLALISIQKRKDILRSSTGLTINSYTPKPFERWLHGFHFGEIWFLDPETAMLWSGRFTPCIISVPYTEWYLPGGVKQCAGGYRRVSKRWKQLDLTGPYSLDMISFRLRRRKAATVGGYHYPAGLRVCMSALRAAMPKLDRG